MRKEFIERKIQENTQRIPRGIHGVLLTEVAREVLTRCTEDAVRDGNRETTAFYLQQDPTLSPREKGLKLAQAYRVGADIVVTTDRYRESPPEFRQRILEEVVQPSLRTAQELTDASEGA